MKNSLVMGVAAAALLSLTAGPASAQWVLNSTNGGDGHLGIPDPGYLYQIVGSDNDVGESLTTLENTAAMAETLTFKWSYTTMDCCGSVYDPGGYVINGVLTQLTPSVGPMADIGATYTGVVSLVLGAGDTYGFYVDSTDSILGPGTIEFGTVPEPSTWAMLLVGFGVLGYFGVKRRNGALASASTES